jgi:probable FeS assembly SUF system protein SufT
VCAENIARAHREFHRRGDVEPRRRTIYNRPRQGEASETMERVELTREVEGVEIPAGIRTTLEKGVEAFITQALGGTFTVQVPALGGMFRIAGKDADALGKSPADAGAVVAGGGDLESAVWEQLKTCYDPEIPVNIVDLGLVYGMEVKDQADGTRKVEVKMTLTAQGCGMGASIAYDAKQKIMTLPGVSEAEVELVWDPPWNPQMISPEGRERLGLD